MHRNYSIDLIKIFAMYGVIALHTTLYYISEDSFLANILFYTFVVSVPLFFMTSGYLLLGRRNVDYGYVKVKIINIIKVVAFFVLIWWLMTSIKQHDWNVKSLIGNIGYSFFQKGAFWQFWYFGAMIILYVFYPLINRMYLNNFPLFVYLTLILILIQTVVFNFNIVDKSKDLMLIFEGLNFRNITNDCLDTKGSVILNILTGTRIGGG